MSSMNCNDPSNMLHRRFLLIPPFLGNGSPHETKSPDGSTNMSFLRGFTNPMQKKVTRGRLVSAVQYLADTTDGQPAKRRGPKPDSKPAQTRRQELNRQAQR